VACGRDRQRRLAPDDRRPAQHQALPVDRWPAGKINLTDPDARTLKSPRGWVLGYNAQAVVTTWQIIVAAEVDTENIDRANLQPMIQTACDELRAAGVDRAPEVIVADAGYWKTEAIEALVAQGIQTLVAPDADRRNNPSPNRRGGLYDFMRRVLATDHGSQLYTRRQATIEPVFGQIKHNRSAERFQRRGRSAARSEWRLLAATHNILKLWRHTAAAATA
jgi:Transposase DDE domain